MAALKRRIVRPLSLASQITIVMAGLNLLFLVITSSVMLLLLASILRGNDLQQRQRSAAHSAALLDSLLQEQQQQLGRVFPASNSNSGPLLPKPPQQELQALLTYSPFQEVMLYSADGQVTIAQTGDGATLLPQALDNNPDSAITLMTATDAPPYLLFRERVSHPNYPNHWLVARWNLSDFQRSFQQRSTGLQGRSQVLDAAGQVVLPMSAESSPPSSNDDNPASASLTTLPWTVHQQVEGQAPLDDVLRVLVWLVAMMGSLAVVALALGRMVAGQMMYPLTRLGLLAKHIEAGDYQHPVEIYSPYEIAEVAAAFNHMGEVVAQREQELRITNNAFRRRSEELADLSRRLIQVEEEERRRISRELHDGFGQTLAALKMTIGVAQRIQDPQRQAALLQEAQSTTDQAIDEVHTISQNLRPTVLDDLGLLPALEWYVQNFEQRFGITVAFRCDYQEPPQLAKEVEVAAYRFLQEALTNARKHAQASLITVLLRPHAAFAMLVVKDDGQGFNYRQQVADHGRAHLGLSGLQERLHMIGGELVIHSEKGSGTSLIALLPQPEASP